MNPAVKKTARCLKDLNGIRMFVSSGLSDAGT
jgi:hypothetical protein